MLDIAGVGVIGQFLLASAVAPVREMLQGVSEAHVRVLLSEEC